MFVSGVDEVLKGLILARLFVDNGTVIVTRSGNHSPYSRKRFGWHHTSMLLDHKRFEWIFNGISQLTKPPLSASRCTDVGEGADSMRHWLRCPLTPVSCGLQQQQRNGPLFFFSIWVPHGPFRSGLFGLVAS